jgi:hypothetical protein
MGRWIFNALVFNLFFIFSCAKGVDNEVYFREGDEWIVKDFSLETYPAVIPFDKNSMVYCLEEELLDCKIMSEDTLRVSNMRQ